MSKYKAFISYSHSTDKTIASKIQHELRVLGRPLFKKEAFKVFRDETNLSVYPDLWSKIESALSKSEFFIFLASPAAAKSKWVKKEIEYWLNHKSVENLIILFSDGELLWNEDERDFDWSLTNCLPVLMKGVYNSEPLYIDLKKIKQNYSASSSKELFRKVVEPISARLHRKSVDDLFGYISRVHRKRVLVRNVVISLMFILSIVLSIVGFSNYNKARSAKLVVEAIRMAEEDPTKAMSLYRKALKFTTNPATIREVEQFNANNVFYVDSIGPFEHEVSNILLLESKNLMAVVYENDSIQIWDMHRKQSISNTIPLDRVNGKMLLQSFKNLCSSRCNFSRISFQDEDNFIVELDTIDTRFQVKFDSSALYFNDYETVVRVGDSLTGIHTSLIGHNSYINEVVLSPNQNLILTASTDRSVKVWSRDGTNIYTLKGHKWDVKIARFIDFGKKVLTIDEYDEYAKIWDLKGYFMFTIPLTNEEMEKLRNGNEDFIDIVVAGFFPGDSVVFSAKSTVDGYYVDIQRISGEQIARIHDIVVEPYAEQGVSLIRSENGILACKENSANIWNILGEELKCYPHKDILFAIASPNESLVLTIGYDSLKVFNLKTTELLTSTSLVEGRLGDYLYDSHTARFSKEEGSFFVGGSGGVLRWRIEDLKIMENIFIGEKVGEVMSMDVSIESNELLVATSDEGIVKVDLSDKSLKVFSNHPVINNTVKYSPDERQFLSSGTTGQAKLWSSSGQILKEFYAGPVLWSLDFSNDGKYIICGSRNGTHIWRGIDPIELR